MKCEDINEQFMLLLSKFVPRRGMSKVFRDVVADTYSDTKRIFAQERNQLITQVTKQNNKITKARELLLADALNANEFKEIKAIAEESVKKLEAKVKELSEKLELDQNILDILDTALENLKNLAGLYLEADVEGKQYIIGSIFRKKFVFDGEIYRTAEMNFAFRLIYQINSPLEAKKNGVGSCKRTNSNQVHL